MTNERKTPVEIFRAAWHEADERGEKGGRVAAGIAALRARGLLVQEPDEDAVEGNAKLLQNSGPSDEQVEAAAKAMHERDLAKSEELYPDRPSMWAKLRPAYYEHARAALVAAQGAAPQAESDERIQAWERLVEHPVWRSCFGEDRPLIDSMMERIDTLAELEKTVNELAPAPALPSSGVDEDALAEVRRQAAEEALLALANELSNREMPESGSHINMTSYREGLIDGVNRAVRTTERRAAEYKKAEE